MINDNTIEIPDNMVFFYEVCKLLYNTDAPDIVLRKKISEEYKYGDAEIDKIHRWVRKLPSDIISDTLAADRFDLFGTKVMELLLGDVTVCGLKRLRKIVGDAVDINSLSSTIGTLLNRLDKIEDKYIEHRLQGVRAGKVASPIDSFNDKPRPHLEAV